MKATIFNGGVSGSAAVIFGESNIFGKIALKINSKSELDHWKQHLQIDNCLHTFEV